MIERRLRVLFLSQRIGLTPGRVLPHGSGAHVAATLAGLRQHFDVHAVQALGGTASGASRLRRLRGLVPRGLRGTRQDARLLIQDRRFTARALAEAAAFGADIVYERSEYLALAGVRVAGRLSVPLVLEVNGVLPSDARVMYRSLAEPLGRLVEVRKHRSAAAIVTVSPGLADRLVELGAEPERIAVIPNTISPDRVRQEPRPVAPGSAVVGWIGHLMDWHADSLEFLIDSAPALVAAVPDVTFMVVGSGPRIGELRQRARRRGVASSFRFVGTVEYEDVPRVVAAFDVGVIPDIFDYAFPVKLVEMGGAGVPVVAPRSSSLDRMLEPGVEYEPFTRGDRSALEAAVVRLLQSTCRRRELGAGLHAAVRDRFTWHESGRQLAGVIERVLEGPS